MDYNEDEIVNYMNNIFILMLRLGPMEEDEVVWPPEGGHELDFSQLRCDITIDPRVISLMKRLPIRKDSDQPIAPEMCSVDYRSPQVLNLTRFIDDSNEYTIDDTGMPSPCASTALLLLERQQARYPSLVLDVEKNTITHFGTNEYSLSDDYTDNEKDFGRLMAYSSRYVNWPTEHAPVFLQRMLDSYLDALWMPMNPTGFFIVDDDEGSAPEVGRVRRILRENYGWPNQFKEQEWKRDSMAMFDREIFGWM